MTKASRPNGRFFLCPRKGCKMYYFFLNDNLLPVPPPKMEIKINNKNKTINLINEGEINIVKTPGLTEVSFEVLLPNKFYPFSQYNNGISTYLTRLMGGTPAITYAKEYVDNFRGLKLSNNPFRLIIARMTDNFQFLSDTNLLVTLEDYSVNESADDGYDWRIPMRLKQYKYYATKELEITTVNGEEVATVKQTRMTTEEVPQAYRVASDMTVWEICKRASGGSLDWRAVANANGISNPNNNVIKGTILTLS